MDDTSTLTLELDAAVTERLHRLAAGTETTPDGLARQAIAEYVERAEANRQFLDDAIAASEEL